MVMRPIPTWDTGNYETAEDVQCLDIAAVAASAGRIVELDKGGEPMSRVFNE